jgi:hypothetical protein
MTEAIENVVMPAPPEERPEQWGRVSVGYSTALKLNMNDYGTWEAIRALYWGQINSGLKYERIEIVPWPEEGSE